MPALNFYLVLAIMGGWFIAANARTISSQALISNVVVSNQRGSFMSFNSSVQQAFIGTASVLAGYIVSNDSSHRIIHYNYVGYLSFAIISVCIYLAYTLGERKVD